MVDEPGTNDTPTTDKQGINDTPTTYEPGTNDTPTTDEPGNNDTLTVDEPGTNDTPTVNEKEFREGFNVFSNPIQSCFCCLVMRCMFTASILANVNSTLLILKCMVCKCFTYS
jgi:hypothetical protein